MLFDAVFEALGLGPTAASPTAGSLAPGSPTAAISVSGLA